MRDIVNADRILIPNRDNFYQPRLAIYGYDSKGKFVFGIGVKLPKNPIAWMRAGTRRGDLIRVKQAYADHLKEEEKVSADNTEVR